MPQSAIDTIKSRISTRGFKDKAVTEAQIRDILDIARWAPSGGNLQPCQVHVVLGAGKERLLSKVKKAIAENPMGEESEIAIYPPNLPDPWRTRRFEVGEAMYQLLGIPREDKASRYQHLARNYDFFGAPTGLFFSIDRRFDKGQWAHLGMFMHSIALVAEEKGLATCMQEAWLLRSKTVSAFLGLTDHQQLYCGMALGYSDPSSTVNQLRSSRAVVDDFTTFVTS